MDGDQQSGMDRMTTVMTELLGGSDDEVSIWWSHDMFNMFLCYSHREKRVEEREEDKY